ncbi:MAG: hypothetical protein ABSH46_15415 [Bryobacteraceae bacterium]|jgi:hypothetical protein
MRALKLAASCAFSVLVALGQTIAVNYPSNHGYRFVRITLDGFREHVFDVTDHGVAVRMKGILLERFLWTAGWDHRPESERPRTRVRVEGGGHAATFNLDEIVPGSFRKRGLLIRERDGKPLPQEECPLLVVLDDHGAVIQTIRGVTGIRVFVLP